MKKTIAILCASALSAIAFGAGDDKPRSVEELAARYQTLHNAKDVDGLINLRYCEGYPEKLKEMDRSFLQDSIKRPIVSIRIEELPPGMKEMMNKGVPYKGKTLYPNLEPLKLLKAELGPGEGLNSIQEPMGETNGVWYLTATKFMDSE